MLSCYFNNMTAATDKHKETQYSISKKVHTHELHLLLNIKLGPDCIIVSTFSQGHPIEKRWVNQSEHRWVNLAQRCSYSALR